MGRRPARFRPGPRAVPRDTLRTESGTLRQITRITPRRGPPVPVFNLEVDAEHVYYVSTAGLLVHNTYPGNAPNRAADALEEGLSVRRGVDIGIKRPPRRHIFPQEMREFFGQRGFKDIDNFTIRLDDATHQAIYKWMGSGPWNDIMKSRILDKEAELARMLTRREILGIGAAMRREAGLSHIKIVPFHD